MTQILLTIIGIVTTLSLAYPETFGLTAGDATNMSRYGLILAIMVAMGLRSFLSRKQLVSVQQQLATTQTDNKQALDANEKTLGEATAKINSLEKALESSREETRLQAKEFAQQHSQGQAEFAAKLAAATTPLQDQLTAAQEAATKYQQAFHDNQAQVDRLQKDLQAANDRQNTASDAASLLRLLQEKGHFLDFVMEDASQISDEDLAAAARLVHQGCQRVIAEYFDIDPIAGEDLGSGITLAQDFAPESFRLTGQVADEGPHTGTLVHKGWAASRINLPQSQTPANGQHVLSPAEIEVSR